MGVLSNNQDLELWLWEYTGRVKAVLQDENKEASDRQFVAKTIYDGLKHKYGFEEALQSGQYAPLPNELSEVNCASQMLVNYLVAKEFNLNPQIIEIDGFRNTGSGFISKHAFIQVDVGDKHPWVICQAMQILGPIKWDKERKRIIVKNIADDGEESQKDFSYSIVDFYPEEEYEERMNYLRSKRGAASVLITGQRVGYYEINKWRMQKPSESSWYIRFDPEQRTINSIVTFNRPLIQNRGIINQVYIDKYGQTIKEEFTGYFYKEEGFAELLGETLMFIIRQIDKAENLSHGLDRLPVDQHYKLEDRVQAFCLGELKDHRQVELIVEEAIVSLEEINKRDTIRADARLKFIFTEALYQHKRKEVGKELVYSSRDRKIALELLKDTNPDVLKALEDIEDLAKTKRIAKTENTRIRNITSRILHPKRIESATVQRYLSIKSQRDMYIYQMEKSIRTFDESADRIAFVQFELKDYLASLEVLKDEAQRRFKDDFDKWINAAYARLFTEFLGNIGASINFLRFLPYRKSIIENVQEHKPALFTVVRDDKTEEQQKKERLESLLVFLAKKDQIINKTA